ncbi:MAG: hypothetical protein R6W91_07545 [Thermoplasmata archaeon]
MSVLFFFLLIFSPFASAYSIEVNPSDVEFLTDTNYDIRIRVLNDTGEPVEGALVRFAEGTGIDNTERYTDSQGYAYYNDTVFEWEGNDLYVTVSVNNQVVLSEPYPGTLRYKNFLDVFRITPFIPIVCSVSFFIAFIILIYAYVAKRTHDKNEIEAKRDYEIERKSKIWNIIQIEKSSTEPLSGQELFDNWKRELRTKKAVRKWIPKHFLNSCVLQGSEQLFGKMEEIHDLKESKSRETKCIPSSSPDPVLYVEKNVVSEPPSEFKESSTFYPTGLSLVGCHDCDSKGILRCGSCGGKGRVLCKTCSGNKSYLCEDCAGNGWNLCGICNGTKDSPCKSCGGNGVHRCYHCHGNIEMRCSSCNGTGHTYSGGGMSKQEYTHSGPTGYKTVSYTDHSSSSICSSCSGKGKVICSVCRGSGNTGCPNCQGSGIIKFGCTACDANGHVVCKTCSGKGRFHCDSCEADGHVQCKSCSGKGILTCKTCNGDKSLKKLDGINITYKHVTSKLFHDIKGFKLDEKDFSDANIMVSEDEFISERKGDIMYRKIITKRVNVTKATIACDSPSGKKLSFTIWAKGHRGKATIFSTDIPPADDIALFRKNMGYKAMMIILLALAAFFILDAIILNIIPF